MGFMIVYDNDLFLNKGMDWTVGTLSVGTLL